MWHSHSMSNKVVDPKREMILSKVRRAAQTTGATPGRQAFERETGIRQSEWLGIYWARWGGTLVEAGLSENQKNAKLDRGAFFAQIAEAFRHYGRVPTTSELRLYRPVDPTFPAHSTVDNHFPTKAALLDAMAEWTRDRPDFADVAQMLPAAPVPTRSRRPAVVDGSVCLIGSGAHCKIGRSDQLERRVKEILTTLPDAATLVHSIRTDDPAGIEAYWHRRFADRRANGEWFKLTPADLAAFKRQSFQWQAGLSRARPGGAAW
jgi:AcrR family transcriptional regulator